VKTIALSLYAFLLTTLIAFLGLFVGAVLTHYTKNEVHQFKRFLPLFQYICLILVFLLFFIYFPLFVALMILILSFLFIFFFWRKKDINFLDYVVLSILFAFSSIQTQVNVYMSLIIFLFGLFSGALFYVLHSKAKKGYGTKHAHVLNIQHYKHSGKELSYGEILITLFNKYYFFIVLSIASYAIAQILTLLI